MPRGAAEDDQESRGAEDNDQEFDPNQPEHVQEFDPNQPENADTNETLGKSLLLVSTLIYDNGLVINISCFSPGRRRSDGSIQYCGR
jgi:hypothetical protein